MYMAWHNMTFLFVLLSLNNSIILRNGDFFCITSVAHPHSGWFIVSHTLRAQQVYVSTLKYNYTNAMVEGKSNKIKVIKRVSYGYRSFRNFKARIMLMERYKIQKGNIHSYKFAMYVAT